MISNNKNNNKDSKKSTINSVATCRRTSVSNSRIISNNRGN